jgi:Glycosyl transferase family 2
VNGVVRRRFPAAATPSRAGAAMVFVLAGVVAAFGTAWFQRICASRVSLDDIGAFNALLALAGGIGVLGLGLQVVLGRLPEAVMPAPISLAVGVVVAVLVGVGMPVAGWYAVAIGALMGATTTATFCGVAARARLLQRASWLRLAVIFLIGVAVRLAVIAPLLAVIGTRLTAAVAATFLAEAAVAVTAVVLAPRRAGAVRRYDQATLHSLVRAVTVLAGLWALTVLDSVLGRLRLRAADADGYSLGTTVARASFFVALLLTQLALPTFVRERGRSARTREVFASAAVTIVGVAATMAAVVVAVPTWVANTVLGEDAAVVDVSTLRLLAAAWAAMSIVPLLTYFHLDRHRRLALVPAGGAAVLVAAGLTVDTSDSLAVVTVVVFASCLVVMGLPAVQRLAPVTRAVAWTQRADDGAGEPADIAMVVPFFNPGGPALVDTVRRLAATLERLGGTFRVVAVSDGSTDGSAAQLVAATIPHVEVLILERNRGKGAALRAGLAHTHGAFVGYIDADGDIPPEQVAELAHIAVASGADAVIASKVHPDSQLAVARHRSAVSAVFRRMVRVLFRLDVRDTQTGLKLYRGSAIEGVGPLLREDGFAIDVEILVAVRHIGRLSIVEAPVRIVASHRTTVSWRRAAATAGGLCRIFWRTHVGLRYEPVVPVPSAVPS